MNIQQLYDSVSQSNESILQNNARVHDSTNKLIL
jgi:hypothetical protein